MQLCRIHQLKDFKYQHASRLHMLACLVDYVMWTAETLADPALIDCSQAPIDNGLSGWRSH